MRPYTRAGGQDTGQDTEALPYDFRARRAQVTALSP